MASNLAIPKAIHLYDEGSKGIDFRALQIFIKKNFGKIPVKIIKLKDKAVQAKGLIFDPLATKESFDKFHRAGGKRFKTEDLCHIVLTDRLIATYDEHKRLQIRAAAYGYPSVISLPGIVEGPAKPKDYYIYKDKFTKLGVLVLEEPEVKRKFKSRFIDYGDKRINEALKGYVSQALFFYMTGEPFCEQKKCRLFNSHWQEDLIYSQVRVGKFCPSHEKILIKVRSLERS